MAFSCTYCILTSTNVKWYTRRYRRPSALSRLPPWTTAHGHYPLPCLHLARLAQGPLDVFPWLSALGAATDDGFIQLPLSLASLWHVVHHCPFQNCGVSFLPAMLVQCRASNSHRPMAAPSATVTANRTKKTCFTSPPLLDESVDYRERVGRVGHVPRQGDLQDIAAGMRERGRLELQRRTDHSVLAGVVVLEPTATTDCIHPAADRYGQHRVNCPVRPGE